MKIFRKKGVYTYWTILYLLMFMFLGCVEINIHMAEETHRRVVMATDEVARERARAIDTILKEQEGVVELFHTDSNYDSNLDKYALSGANVYTIPVQGHNPPKEPGSTLYNQSLNKADQVAKSTAVDYLTYIFRENVNGKPLLKDFTASNVCVDIEPLPSSSDWNKKRNFSCTTSLGKVEVDNVDLSTVEQNSVTLLDPDSTPNSGDEQELHVLNVAFVGIKYEHYYFLSKFMEQIGLSPTSIKTTWALAYPQVDKCYEGALHCDYASAVAGGGAGASTSSYNITNGVAMSTSFSGSYGVSGGNKSDGGTVSGTYYYWAKNRYIDLGTEIEKYKIKALQFTSVTGGGDTTPRPTYFQVSDNGTDWFDVGNANATFNTWGDLTVDGNSIPISKIRYVKASNSFCLDVFKFVLTPN